MFVRGYFENICAKLGLYSLGKARRRYVRAVLYNKNLRLILPTLYIVNMFKTDEKLAGFQFNVNLAPQIVKGIYDEIFEKKYKL